jgi:hypothetical protein
LFGTNGSGAFVKAVGAVAAAGFATVSAFQVVVFGEYAIAFWTEVIIDTFHEIIWIELFIHNYKINNFAGMKVIVSKYLTPVGFRALTIYPFVFLREAKDKDDVVLLHHERIHLHQQKELLWVFFFLWYGLEFMVRWMRLRNKHAAYRAICFEREAYQNEKDLHFLERRPFWNFMCFIRK